MPFIDWNGDGKIDPVDIGISIATEIVDDEESTIPPPEIKQKSRGGCLSTTLTLIGIITVTIFMIVGWS